MDIADHFNRTGGGMGMRIASHDWHRTPLGTIQRWPRSLVSSLSIALTCSAPTAIYWGREFRLLFNDAWARLRGDRTPDGLGRPAHEAGPDVWPVLRPHFETAWAGGLGRSETDLMLPFEQEGRPTRSYWDYSITPILDDDGTVAGLFNQGQETTDRVERLARAALVIDYDERARTERSPAQAIAIGLALLGRHLGAGRVGYAEIDRATGIATIEPCWTDGRMTDIAGRFPVGTFGATLHETLARNQPYVMPDTAADLRLTAAERAQYAALGIGAGLVVPVVAQEGYLALVFAHEPAPRHWSDHQQATMRRIAMRMWQEVARMRAEMVLRDSEQRYRLIFEQAQDMIFTADLDQRITAANAACATAVRLTVDQAIGRRIDEFLEMDDRTLTAAMLGKKLRHGGTTRYEVRLRQPDGAPRLIEVNSTLATDAEGAPSGLHGIARDITERRAFADRQTALIDELNHRVKNTLALVQGLALQSFRGERDPKAAQEVFQQRLATLASAHDLLTRADWDSADLADLARAALGHMDDPAGRIAIAGPAVRLAPKAAISLVLVLNELAVNAVAHGALSVPAGGVALGWTFDDGALRLEWREHGGPPVAPPAGRGFGLRMIERALANDLGARVETVFDEAGFRLVAEAARGRIEE